MKLENMPVAVLAYFESCIMPQIPTSLGKAMTYGGLLLTMPKLESVMKENAPMLVNETGDLDLSKLNSIGITVLEKVPKIQIGNFEFDRNDFEKFISFLSTQA